MSSLTSLFLLKKDRRENFAMIVCMFISCKNNVFISYIKKKAYLCAKNMTDEQSARDEFYMRLALHEAEQAGLEGEVPIGAIVVSRGRVIARAHNQTETLHDVTAHAEMLAITAAANLLGGKYLTDCTLYVTVEPCVMCAGAIGWAQIKRLVYGASDAKRGFSVFAPHALHPKATITKGVLNDECRAIMQSFFLKKRLM